MTTVESWVKLLALPPAELTEGQVVALRSLVDTWGSSAELGAIECGQHERVWRRYVRQTIAQDLRRPAVSLAPLLLQLMQTADPVATAIAFYGTLPSPARYTRSLADLARYWAEWSRTDDARYRANLEIVSSLVATTIGRRDIRDLVERARMHA